MKMLPYSLQSSTLDPEKSFSTNQQVAAFDTSPSTLNLSPYPHPYCCYSISSPPFSLSTSNYDSLLEASLDGVSVVAAAKSPPPPDPAAKEVAGLVAAKPAAGTTEAGNRRKRFRTDRHSKILTSQGLRDRRMRLSLGVARQFFRLQDMLGFDKASHTISWLIHQAKPAIDLLATCSALNNANTQTLNSSGIFLTTQSSASSECEVVSSYSNHKAMLTADVAPLFSPPSKAKGHTRFAVEASLDGRSTRESREKARARARERTMEKKQKIKSSDRQF